MHTYLPSDSRKKVASVTIQLITRAHQGRPQEPHAGNYSTRLLYSSHKYTAVRPFFCYTSTNKSGGEPTVHRLVTTKQHKQVKVIARRQYHVRTITACRRQPLTGCGAEAVPETRHTCLHSAKHQQLGFTLPNTNNRVQTQTSS